MAGGGGSTGAVKYPDYMEEIHQDWLGYSSTPTAVTTDFISVLDTALATNPLDSLSYDDPSTDVAAIQSEYDTFNTKVDALDETSDWPTIVDTAVAKVDTAGVLTDIDLAALISAAQTEAGNDLQAAIEKALTMVDDVIVEEAITKFIRVREKERARLKTQYKAGMSNISAERSSSYALGLALMEIDFEREVGQYESQLSLQLYQQGIQFYAKALATELDVQMKARTLNKQTRDNLMLNGISQMLQFKQFVVEMKKQLTTVLTELKRIGFVMNSEYVGNTADLNWKHSSWDMQTYSSAIAILGGLGGSQFVPKGPSKVGSALGGALQGAGTGAAVGSVVPGLGTAVGAGIGAAVGLGAGIFS